MPNRCATSPGPPTEPASGLRSNRLRGLGTTFEDRDEVCVGSTSSWSAAASPKVGSRFLGPGVTNPLQAPQEVAVVDRSRLSSRRHDPGRLPVVLKAAITLVLLLLAGAVAFGVYRQLQPAPSASNPPSDGIVFVGAGDIAKCPTQGDEQTADLIDDIVVDHPDESCSPPATTSTPMAATRSTWSATDPPGPPQRPNSPGRRQPRVQADQGRRLSRVLG